VPAPYRGLLFDLFGTLIRFEPDRLPEAVVDGRRQRLTLGALAEPLERWVPGVSLDDFFAALVGVSDAMARARVDDHVEPPSRERFRRALERVGCDDGVLLEAAVDLSRAHMARIAAATAFPPAHAALLTRLRPGRRLAVVTNFDDTATAYAILVRHGILPLVDTIVVSEALGIRKPHPALLRTALRDLEVAPADALFVGDNFTEDVGAANAAGVDAAWIDAAGTGVPATARTAPRFVLRQLADLDTLLRAS
jgi:HAD superfamily hydrolase (TIGR01549 family)